VFNLYNRIEELRKEFNYTLDFLAEYLSVSDRMIRYYEQGSRLITLQSAIKLCELFSCSLDYLLCRTEARNNNINAEKNYLGIIEYCIKNKIPPEPLKKLIDTLKDIHEDINK
jgi:transcriptional regulator with XRE-family HTH domain